MAAQRESSVEESEWAGVSESGDDDMDFEVWTFDDFCSIFDVARFLGREELGCRSMDDREFCGWNRID